MAEMFSIVEADDIYSAAVVVASDNAEASKQRIGLVAVYERLSSKFELFFSPEKASKGLSLGLGCECSNRTSIWLPAVNINAMFWAIPRDGA
eukprot:scaffold19606_cov19-Prasinocladus_malaysianus.AAC.1